MSALKRLALRGAFRTGALARLRPRPALTVVMFHRVVEPGSIAARQADPTYAVSTVLFDQLLGFFRDHYSVVTLEQVFQAATAGVALPSDPLLITFDDGWADNLHCAAPLLRAHRLPAVIFIATEAVQSDDAVWWQERVFAAARGGHLTRANLPAAPGNGASDRLDPLDTVCWLAALPEGERTAALQALPEPAHDGRMMLTPDEVARLADFGIAVGVHTHRHLPLTRVEDLGTEFAAARTALAAMGGGAVALRSLACPHGRHDARVFAAARAADMALMFTSEPVLNRLQDGRLSAERPIGRISMEESQLCDAAGRPDQAMAARWLWRRALV
jgi:peptidoglycan/xylan/chitin deacetylase (PgdA/CDA1 family)